MSESQSTYMSVHQHVGVPNDLFLQKSEQMVRTDMHSDNSGYFRILTRIRDCLKIFARQSGIISEQIFIFFLNA